MIGDIGQRSLNPYAQGSHGVLDEFQRLLDDNVPRGERLLGEVAANELCVFESQIRAREIDHLGVTVFGGNPLGSVVY